MYLLPASISDICVIENVHVQREIETQTIWESSIFHCLHVTTTFSILTIGLPQPPYLLPLSPLSSPPFPLHFVSVSNYSIILRYMNLAEESTFKCHKKRQDTNKINYHYLQTVLLFHLFSKTPKNMTCKILIRHFVYCELSPDLKIVGGHRMMQNN